MFSQILKLMPLECHFINEHSVAVTAYITHLMCFICTEKSSRSIRLQEAMERAIVFP